MEANTYVPIAGILDLLNKFPSATPCLRSLLLALPGRVMVFSSPTYSSHTAGIRGPAGPRAGALPEMSLSEQHFNLQSHSLPCTTLSTCHQQQQGTPRPSGAGQLEGSQCCICICPGLLPPVLFWGPSTKKLWTIPAPSPKLLLRAEAELMLSQWSETSSFSEPQFQHCKVEALIPTSMSSYYVPDAGKIITRGKIKSWMIVSVLRPCKTGPERQGLLQMIGIEPLTPHCFLRISGQ